MDINSLLITAAAVICLTSLASFILLLLYLGAVERAMRRKRLGDDGREEQPRELEIIALGPGTPMSELLGGAKLWRQALRARYSVVLIYTLAGLAHVVVSALAFRHAYRVAGDNRLALALGVALLWPLGQTYFTQLDKGIPTKVLAGVVYLAALFWALESVPDVIAKLADAPARFLFLMAAFVPLIKILVMNRWLRVTGVTVLVFAVSVAVGAFLAYRLDALLSAGPLVVRVATAVVVLEGSAVVGWLLVQWFALCHERKWLNDQTAVVFNLWLIQTEWLTFLMASAFGAKGLWALLSFPAYFATVRAGFYARRRLLRGRPRDVRRLLVLRTFSKGGCFEEWAGEPGRGVGARVLLGLYRIFDPNAGLLQRIEKRWRHVGSVQLIAGPDLAAAYADVDEMVGWIRGNLKDRFIKSEDDLTRRLAKLDTKPDLDGRYRVNEFFCSDWMWGRTLERLLKLDEEKCSREEKRGREEKHRQVVLVDARGLSEKRQGVIHELQKLVEDFPLGQVVVAVDGKTDMPLFEQKLAGFWKAKGAGSVNQKPGSNRLHVYHVGWSDHWFNRRSARRLFALLLRAADDGAARGEVA
ncbi:MAG TPA: hypothetical protein VJ866_06555 [Pyrinomonadaceae bacterium]|nr:hypothetical protein [Pyrinomonadaceae bacterium]